MNDAIRGEIIESIFGLFKLTYGFLLSEAFIAGVILAVRTATFVS